ncbi:MAG: trehalase-like domain-containing protein [Rhodothermales bacterium]
MSGIEPSAPGIADYAMLSDCHSAALVSRHGSVDWLCLPRFDAPSIFARLLDAEGGHWVIRPAGETDVSRRYVEGTLVLETTFTTERGRAVMVDALAVGADERGHELGRSSPHALLRTVECVEGVVSSGSRRRRAQLGLPLHVDSRRQLDARSALGGRLPR